MSNVRPAVQFIATLVLIAAAHIAWLFGAYGTKLFGTQMPSALALFIWLGVSTLAAVIGYSKVATRMPWFSVEPYRRYLFALVAGAASLYIGVFLAFNTFGT